MCPVWASAAVSLYPILAFKMNVHNTWDILANNYWIPNSPLIFKHIDAAVMVYLHYIV